MYAKNYKTLLKEIKEDLNKWKDIPCSPIRKLIIGLVIHPKLIYRFNTIPNKIPAGFLAELTNTY